MPKDKWHPLPADARARREFARAANGLRLHPFHIAEPQEGEVVIPRHLLDYEYNSLEDARSDLVTSMENKRRHVWALAYRLAAARCQWPGERHLVRDFATTLGVSTETVRRYMSIGYHFPPTVPDEHGFEQDLVMLSEPLNLYYAALQATRYGLDPLACVQIALESEWPNKTQGLLSFIREDDNHVFSTNIFEQSWTQQTALPLLLSHQVFTRQVSAPLWAALQNQRTRQIVNIRIRVDVEYVQKENAND